MSDIEPVQSVPALPVVAGPPGLSEWDAIMRQAEVLARSGLVPARYRGKADDVVVAALMGRELGWGPTTALRHVNVIEGQATLSAEGMGALVRSRGHSIEGDTDPYKAVLRGKRADTGDTMEVTFTVDDAVQAGLCTIQDGKPRARSRQGNKLPWETHTEDMLYARAMSRLCRRLFGDVLAGISYVPEELEAVYDKPPAGSARSSSPVLAPPVVSTTYDGPQASDEDKQRIQERLRALPDVLLHDAKEGWRREFGSLNVNTLPAELVEQADRFCERFEERVAIADVEGVNERSKRSVAGQEDDKRTSREKRMALLFACLHDLGIQESERHSWAAESLGYESVESFTDLSDDEVSRCIARATEQLEAPFTQGELVNSEPE